MTAREAWSMGADWLEFIFVTPEERPLAIFGGAASDAVAELLGRAGIEFVGSALHHGRARPPGRRPGRAPDRRQPRGQPAPARGPADPRRPGRRRRVRPGRRARPRGRPERVYAAGDGTAFPIKQGGLATQQADAVAETIAAAVGAPVEPEPFRPVLRGMLLTGGDDRFMRTAIAGGEGEPKLASCALWWPPSKIAGRYLAPFLFDRDELDAVERIRGDHLAVEADFSRAGAPAAAVAAS